MFSTVDDVLRIPCWLGHQNAYNNSCTHIVADEITYHQRPASCYNYYSNEGI